MNEAWARRVWERKGVFAGMLWVFSVPLSLVYLVGIQTRNLLYALGCMSRKRLPCAVVSVGNLTVGGTGKTPATLWIARELRRRGYRVAILTRGYKRKGKDPVVLEPGWGSSPSTSREEDLAQAGDEALMMARLFGQKVGVGENRYEVGRMLLRDGAVDLFLLDDGFQHRQLERDVDLLLLGSSWNGWLLPAGPWREPEGALRRADLYLVTAVRERWEKSLSRRPKGRIFFGSLQAKGLWTLEDNQYKEFPLSMLSRSKILTVCGIADPAAFYRMIHEWDGEIVDAMEFPDHHTYSTTDWQRINRAARHAELIVTTEKDILKLVRFPFARQKLLALRVEMVVEQGDALLQAMEQVIEGKRRDV